MSAPDDTPRPTPDVEALAGLARAGAESLFRTLSLVARATAPRPDPEPSPPDDDLRASGDHLLARSRAAAPQRPEDHPAFARVLDELSPDEARILRLLASSGPQPALEVRRRDRLGRPAETLAAGLTLVARQAGCADPARGPEYLGNLQRLGLVDPAGPRLPDVRRYALLEAQPSTLQARAGARTRTVHRSVRLTAFGEQFVQVCFTLDGADAAHWSRDRHDPPAP